MWLPRFSYKELLVYDYTLGFNLIPELVFHSIEIGVSTLYKYKILDEPNLNEGDTTCG